MQHRLTAQHPSVLRTLCTYTYVYICRFVLSSTALHNSIQCIYSSPHIAHSVSVWRVILWQKGVQLAVTRCVYIHTCIRMLIHAGSKVQGSEICIFMHANDCTMITLEFRSRLISSLTSPCIALHPPCITYSSTATRGCNAVPVEHIKMREKCSLI